MLNRDKLRRLLLRSLRDQGFRLRRGSIIAPSDQDKALLRDLHQVAVRHQVEKARKGLERYEPELLNCIAAGSDVNPLRIWPRIVEVKADSKDELLFRYARLHWSIPVSAGYGRRLRFVIYDEANGKLMGIIGLADPIIALGPRDRWIGWDRDSRLERLQCTMEAFVLGAIPPYSKLLCGKLMALLLASNEVRDAFFQKYKSTRSYVSDRALDGRLVLVTTNSALGRSSIYNRLQYHDGTKFEPLGFTLGSGEFHFSNGVYHELRAYGERYCTPTSKQESWGIGFRNKRELIRKVLPKLGLSSDLVYHQVRREVFGVPLASNSRDFLRGEHTRVRWFDRPADEIFAWFRERWLLPRAACSDEYQHFSTASYRLWA